MATVTEGNEIIKKLREIMDIPDGITYFNIELKIDDFPKITMEFVPMMKGKDEPTK